MKEDIKEIIRLNCEEEIDVKYFAKDDSLVDTTMDYSQLLDYINNLQEENKELNRMCEMYSKSLYNADLTKAEKRIDKAIEYINTHLYMESTCGIQHATFDGKPAYDFDCFDLLDLLNGGDE